MKKIPLHLATLLTAATPMGVFAAPLYWDNNGATPGAGAGNATTIWNTASVWTTDSAGGDGVTPVPGTWVAGSDAVFSAGSDATGIITITPNAAVAANSITVEEGTVLTAGQVVTIGAANGAAGITINNGAKLSINSTTQIVPSSTPNLVLNGGTLENRIGANGSTFLNAGFKMVLAGAGGTLNMPGPGVTSFAFNYLPTVGISGSGGLTIQGNLIQFRTGTATYSYSGPTTITSTGGTMEFKQNTTTNNILPVGTDLTVNSNAVFNLGLASAQVASVSGSGIVAYGSASKVLTISGSTPANDATFNGVIQNAFTTLGSAAGTLGGITKSGSSSQTFNGLNSQTGPTILSAGTITVGSSGALSGGAATLTVNGGILNLNNAAQTVSTLTGAGGTINVGTGHVLTVDPAASGAYAGTIAGPGGLTKANVLSGTTNRTLTLSGPNSYDGNTIVSGGNIAVGSATALGSTVGYTEVASGAEILVTGAGSTFSVAEPLRISGAGNTDAGAIAVIASANPTFSGPVTLTGDATVTVSSSASATFSNPAAFTSPANQNLTLAGGHNAAGFKLIAGAIALGSGGLTKTQGGVWTLAGANTYSGATAITGGTLQLGTGLAGGDGTISNSPTVSVAGGSALVFNRFGADDYGGAISGAGAVTKSGAGVQTLSGANTYTGLTTVGAGTLIVAGSLSGTAGVDVTGVLGGGGVITTASAGNVSLLTGGKLSPGASTDNLTVNLSGGGTLSLTAAVTGSSTGALVYELDTPFISDKVTLTGGALTLGAGELEFDDFVFTILGGFLPGNDYVLFDGTEAISGTLGPIDSGLVGGFPGQLLFADGGNDLVLRVVPEPGTTALLAAGLVPMLRRRKRRIPQGLLR